MSQMQPEMTFAATGDSFITRRLPAADPGRMQIRALLEQAQVRFNNLEMTVHRFEDNDQVFPFAFSGGHLGRRAAAGAGGAEPLRL